jgi:hypothetical protein
VTPNAASPPVSAVEARTLRRVINRFMLELREANAER